MSSQKKSSRLEGKDLITIGIYTVIYVVIVMPVSYTHLDVYKRQGSFFIESTGNADTFYASSRLSINLIVGLVD